MDEFTLIDAGRICAVSAVISPESVRIPAAMIEQTLGWELKPQGLCKGDRCIPAAMNSDLIDEAGVDLTRFATALSRPLALAVAERVAYIGTAAAERAEQLASLAAPDFILPDLDGKPHSLSEHRGRKVLLVAYASW